MPNPLRVLILEDQPTDAELLLHELRRAGFDPEWQRVETEEEYLAALHPALDIIISDYKLPQFDGLSAVRLLRARGLDLPFILVSGTIGEEVAVECIKQGAADYLLKDRLTRLGPAVKSALDQKRLRDERKQAEEALRESEERLRVGLRTANIAVFNQDTDLRYIWMYQPQLGYVSEQVVGHTDAELLPLEAAKQVMEIKRRVFEGGLRERAEVPVSVGGQTFVYDLVAEPLRDVSGAIIGLTGASLDITERKQAEQELVKLQKAVDNSGEVVFMTDRDGLITFVNPEFTRLYGYAAEEVVGQITPRILKSGLVPPEGYAALWQTILNKQLAKGEFVNKTKDGRLLNIEGSVNPILDDGGNIAGFLAIQRDITERKQAEEALRNSEARYRVLFEQSPNGVLLMDLDTGKTIEANETAHKQLGYTREEFAALRISDYEVLEKPEETARRMQKIIREGSDDFETLHRTKTGEIRNMRVLAKTVQLSDRNLFHAIFQDITERKRAEESLHLQSAALNAAANSILITNRDGAIEWVNPAFTTITGYSAEEAIGRSPRELVRSDIQDQAFYKQLWDTILAGEVWHSELINRRKDGSLYTEEETITPLKNADGEITHFIAIKQDITERKWAEEQIRQRLGELEVLYQSGLALSQSLKPKEIAQRIIDLLDQNLGWHHTTVRLYHPQDETLELLAFNQPGLRSEQEKHAVEEHFKTSVAKKGRGLSGWVIEHGQSVRTSDLMNDARYVETFPGLQSGLYVPIIIGERTIGVISIESEEENAFSEADERLTVTLANQAASALENARLFEETRQRLTRIQSLRNIDMAISGSTDLRVTLNVALDEIVNQLGIDAACILRLDPHTQTLEYAAGRGFRTHTIEKSLVRLGEGHAGRAALERRPAHIADLSATGAEFARAGLLASEGFKTYHAIPLIAKGQVLGVLEVFHRAAFESNGEWLDFLETLAGQTVIAMDNTSLFQGLERSNINLLQAYDATIQGWSQAMDLRDKETEGHTQRVTKLTEQLARAIGMSHEEIVHARRGALLHDIGKIGVPDLILLKADKLTEEEWILMKSHPQFAYNMLSPIAYLKPALDIPYCHHEKWDGTGYPRGLKGEQIPLVARLFAIVDVYDALTSDRPYRKAWTKKKTFTYIREQSGTHFDPAVVDAFLAMQLPKRKK